MRKAAEEEAQRQAQTQQRLNSEIQALHETEYQLAQTIEAANARLAEQENARQLLTQQIDALTLREQQLKQEIEALAVHEAEQRAAASQLENEMHESQQTRAQAEAQTC